jgi:hypothetical protein
MTATDYLLNAGLVALVVLQIRGHKITRARLLFPVAATVYVASMFLHSVPTAGNDLAFVAGLAAVGAALGVAAGLATAVSRHGTLAVAKAGTAAAALWVVGIGARTGFALWVSHGGQATVAQFSATHGITTAAAWTAGFVLMAMLEVLTRTAVLYAKAVRTGAEIPRGGLRQRLLAA